MATNTLDELVICKSPCTPDEIMVFTEGDCWKLAYELHQRGVGQIVGAVERDDPDFWYHMAVELEDGTFLDAFGISTRQQFIDRWSEFTKSTAAAIASYSLENPSRWEELVMDQECDFSSPEDVQEVADKLQEWLEDL